MGAPLAQRFSRRRPSDNPVHSGFMIVGDAVLELMCKWMRRSDPAVGVPLTRKGPRGNNHEPAVGWRKHGEWILDARKIMRALPDLMGIPQFKFQA